MGRGVDGWYGCVVLHLGNYPIRLDMPERASTLEESNGRIEQFEWGEIYISSEAGCSMILN